MNAVEERGNVEVHLPTVSAPAPEQLRRIAAPQVPPVVAGRAHPAGPRAREQERQQPAQPASVPPSLQAQDWPHRIAG